jgi:hypothetical protein
VILVEVAPDAVDAARAAAARHGAPFRVIGEVARDRLLRVTLADGAHTWGVDELASLWDAGLQREDA